MISLVCPNRSFCKLKTYNDIYLSTRRRLHAAGIAAFDLEARLIVGHASSKSREELVSSSRFFVMDSAVIHAVDDMIERRLGGEPVAYIVGEWEFYGLPMIVSDAVLVPRVDTEVLADTAISLMKQRGGRTRLLDLCAGSGCVGIAVAANVPDCRVVLADNSPQAMAICRANMLKNRVSRNTTAIEIDALQIPPTLLGIFDAIVSNPPYIPTEEISGLYPSVRDYEPISALDGGPDGLDFFRFIAGNWHVLLRQGGHLAFECGMGQAGVVRVIMEDSGFRNIKTHADTLNIQRVIVGKKK